MGGSNALAWIVLGVIGIPLAIIWGWFGGRKSPTESGKSDSESGVIDVKRGLREQGTAIAEARKRAIELESRLDQRQGRLDSLEAELAADRERTDKTRAGIAEALRIARQKKYGNTD